MEISFIHMYVNRHLRANKTNFHIKGFALGLALKQRRNATRKSPIKVYRLKTMCYTAIEKLYKAEKPFLCV